MQKIIDNSTPGGTVLVRIATDYQSIGPVRFDAFNLGPGCQVQFERVLMQHLPPTLDVDGCNCAVTVPPDAIVEASQPFQPCCGIDLYLTEDRRAAIIDLPGLYRVSLAGTGCASALVTMQELPVNYRPRDSEYGCCRPQMSEDQDDDR